MKKRIFLAGDVGGTSTRLALYEEIEENGAETIKELFVGKFPSQDFSGLPAIVREFLPEGISHPSGACFGIPGPVINGTVTTTNLPWVLREEDLVRDLAVPAVRLVNDLATVAAALPYLSPEALLTLHPGSKLPPESATKVCAVVAPGTGMGQSMLWLNQGTPQIFSSEGGHVNFAPTTPLEWDLFQYLLRTLRRVSVERLCSGPGIYNIYAFLRDRSHGRESPVIRERMRTVIAPKVIADSALSGECALCNETMEIFCRVLGSHAGNVALTYQSTGGVFLGGGIAPKVLKFLEQSGVVEAFLSKGRLTPMVEATPLYVIKDDRAGLQGAARLAAALILRLP